MPFLYVLMKISLKVKTGNSVEIHYIPGLNAHSIKICKL